MLIDPIDSRAKNILIASEQKNNKKGRKNENKHI